MSTLAPPAAEDRQTKGRRSVFPMHRLKLEARDQPDGRRRIEGYAAVFGNRDTYGDIILPGAFARTLRERTDVKVLWQHDPTQPIGRMEAGYEDEFGLAVTGALTNTQKVREEVLPLLQDEVVTGLSIGYDVVTEEFNADAQAWFLKDIDLWEWSPVTFAANELASVSEVKDLGNRDDGHAARVQRHAKALEHELTGYFKRSDRQTALDCAQLAQLHAALGGILPDGDGPGSVDDQLIEAAYLQGAVDALDGTFTDLEENHG